MNETIGERLRRLRLERSLSQRELSGPGVSYAYISRIEAGARRPSVKALRTLARKLRVSPEYLETGSEIRDVEERELQIADAELQLRLGDDDATVEQRLRELLDEAVHAGDAAAATRARTAIGLAAAQAHRHEEAIRWLEQGIAAGVSPVARPDVYATLGSSYSALGRPERAVELFERCLEEVTEAAPEDTATQIRFATYLSYALTDAGDLGRAQAVLQKVVSSSGTTADPYTRVRLYWSLGRLATHEGKSVAALGYFRRAVALLEATDDTLHLAKAHLSCAWTLTSGGRPEEAGYHLELAERLFGPNAAPSDLGWLRTEQAKRAVALGESEDAVAYAREALELLADQDPAEQGAAWAALGEALGRQGEVAAADDAFRRAAELLGRYGQSRDRAGVYRAWGKMLRGAGRETDALDVLEQAADVAVRGGDSPNEH